MTDIEWLHPSSIALEDGIALREWIERVAKEVSFKTVRCATYAISVLGLQWLRRLAHDRQAHIRLLLDVGQTDPRIVRSMATMFASGKIECRTAPARPGPVRDEEGLFHPKILILDDAVAVIGSVNLTGKGLGLGIQPHNVEMSIGLSGTSSQLTIKQLVEVFDRWWEDSQPLQLHLGDEDKKENQHMAQPEYVVFQDRPMWGIAQVQTEGSGLFGQEQWLAVSDISPVDPEHHPARIQVPQQFVEAVNPQPWDTPAAQLARGRNKSGGINHPKIAIALRTLRTPENIDGMPRLALGLGTYYDKEFFACFSDGADEPVVLLSYLVAHLRDEHFFCHELRLFALSPSNPKSEELKPKEDGKLVENIIWSNLRKGNIKCSSPDLDQSFLEEILSQDAHIREELGSEVRDEEGRWRGAVWPLAVTVLLPTASSADNHSPY